VRGVPAVVREIAEPDGDALLFETTTNGRPGPTLQATRRREPALLAPGRRVVSVNTPAWPHPPRWG